jgi:hypothetical protein
MITVVIQDMTMTNNDHNKLHNLSIDSEGFEMIVFLCQKYTTISRDRQTVQSINFMTPT